MREILYKAKRSNNGEWVEGLIFYSSGTGEWKMTFSDNWQPSYPNSIESKKLRQKLAKKYRKGFKGKKDK